MCFYPYTNVCKKAQCTPYFPRVPCFFSLYFCKNISQNNLQKTDNLFLVLISSEWEALFPHAILGDHIHDDTVSCIDVSLSGRDENILH